MPRLRTVRQEGRLSNTLDGFSFNLLSQQQNFPFPPAATKTSYSFLSLSQDWVLPLSRGAGHVSHRLHEPPQQSTAKRCTMALPDCPVSLMLGQPKCVRPQLRFSRRSSTLRAAAAAAECYLFWVLHGEEREGDGYAQPKGRAGPGPSARGWRELSSAVLGAGGGPGLVVRRGAGQRGHRFG